jgi:hypothetical protein
MCFDTVAPVAINGWEQMLGHENDEWTFLRPDIRLDEKRDSRLEQVVQLFSGSVAAPIESVQRYEKWAWLTIAISRWEIFEIPKG